jgi:sortase A
MSRSPLAWLERLLFVVGLACLGWYTYATTAAATIQRAQRTEWQTRAELAGSERSRDEAESAETGPATETDGAADGGPIGLLEIPRLGISAAVVSGDDEDALAAAAGHLRDTPRPWEPGNSAIAAHRDGLFRPLKRIQRGDLIRLQTPRGALEYRVDELKVVRPTDLSVLQPRRTDSITLITCYPFNYVGSAPQRFIVHAERTGGHALAADRLPSRSLAVFTSYRGAPSRVSQIVAAGARRATIRRADRTAALRHARQRHAVNSDRGKAPRVTGRDRHEDERPAKRRRWFHIFRRQ